MRKTTLKKLMSGLLAACTLFALTACGSNETTSQTQAASQSQEPTVPESSEPEESVETTSAEETETQRSAEDASGGKTLVVYYSATGNTENVANAIASATGGDLFELTPVEPYTDEDLDWTNDDSRVSREHADESLRTIELETTTVEDWDSYDTVYIGYPIWWGIAAWPVDSFVSANDFTGKNVIPFATAASSGMGQSGELLAELAGTGNWQEGQRFRSGVSEADVTEWVNSLEIN